MILKNANGAEDGLWRKCLPGKCEIWSSDSQTLGKCWLGVTAYL